MGTEFFENLGKTLSETAKTVGERTDEFIAIQKLRSQQTSLESEVKKNYKIIGEMVFQKFVDGEAYCEEIAEACREIMQLQSEIAECKETIAEKKGQIICPACGASAPREADFCMKCGSPIPKPEKTEDAEFSDADIFEDETDEVKPTGEESEKPAGEETPETADVSEETPKAEPSDEASEAENNVDKDGEAGRDKGEEA